MIKKILFFLFVVLVGFGAYWFYMHKESSLQGPQAVTTSTPVSVKIKLLDVHKKEGDNSMGYLIDLTYPQVSGIPQAAADAVNKKIEEFVTTNTVAFKANAEDSKKEKDLPGSEFRMDYTLTALNDKILSLEFNVYEYRKGAAHPNSLVHGFNYDVKNNRVVNTLQDVFVPGSNYLQTISDFSRTDLKEQLKENISSDESFEEGTAPKAENFQEFVLTTHGLKLIFNPYQIGPYALGGRTVLIPYEQLKDMLPAGSFLLNFK